MHPYQGMYIGWIELARIRIYIYILWIKVSAGVCFHVLLGLYGRSSVCTRLLCIINWWSIAGGTYVFLERSNVSTDPCWLPTYGDSRKEDCCFLMRERARQRDESFIYHHWISRFLLHEGIRGGSKSHGLRFIESLEDRSFSNVSRDRKLVDGR